MTELIIAGWGLTAALLFLPVGPIWRLAARRVRPGRVRRPGTEPHATLDESADGGVLTPAEATATAAAAETGPEDAGQPLPRGDAPSKTSARYLFAATSMSAQVALYVLFIVSSVYLAPRLLERVLDNEHPLAAITSQSMYPTLKKGDLVVIEGVDSAADLNVGDIIAFRSENGFAIHRLVLVDGEALITQGDANLLLDEPISFDDVIGRLMKIGGRFAKIPYLGNIPLVFGSTIELEGGQVEDSDQPAADAS